MRAVALFAFVLVGCSAEAVTPSPSYDLAQVRVIDGDTFELNGEMIRIANIDTPETGDRAGCWAEARLAREATFALEMQALDWEVTPPHLERQGKDRYGRTLARVRSHGQDVGSAMIDSGHAVEWTGRRFAWCEPIDDREGARRLISGPPTPINALVAEARR